MFSKKLFQKVMPFLTYRDFSTRLESIYLIECMIQNTLLPNKNKYLDFEADFSFDSSHKFSCHILRSRKLGGNSSLVQ